MRQLYEVFCFYSYVGPNSGQGVHIVSRRITKQLAKNSKLLWLFGSLFQKK